MTMRVTSTVTIIMTNGCVGWGVGVSVGVGVGTGVGVGVAVRVGVDAGTIPVGVGVTGWHAKDAMASDKMARMIGSLVLMLHP